MKALFELERTTGPQVWNKHRKVFPEDAVYIGRSSQWGNPYSIEDAGSRDEAIRLFEEYLLNNPALMAAVKRELAGKDLLCFCKPAACHGDVLLRVANEG